VTLFLHFQAAELFYYIMGKHYLLKSVTNVNFKLSTPMFHLITLGKSESKFATKSIELNCLFFRRGTIIDIRFIIDIIMYSLIYYMKLFKNCGVTVR
jgi:hypothetical protein